MDELKLINSNVWGEPYEYYRILGELEEIPLKIHPIMVRDKINFLSCVSCLMMKKNKSTDINIIKMSYLDYLFYVSSNSEQNEVLINMLFFIFKLILKEQPFNFFYNEDKTIYFTINNLQYTSQDFDNIKNIMFEQNDVDDDELFFDKEIEEALEKAKKFKEKHSNESPNFEEVISFYSVYMHMQREKIEALTIRQLNKDLSYIQQFENWKICMVGEMSGATFKDEVKYFLSHIPKQGILSGLVDEDVQGFMGNAKNMLS